MSLWKVRVACYGEKVNSKLKRKDFRCYMDAIVEAQNDKEAAQAGVNFIELEAPSDTHWKEFQWREVTKLSLPMLMP